MRSTVHTFPGGNTVDWYKYYRCNELVLTELMAIEVAIISAEQITRRSTIYVHKIKFAYQNMNFGLNYIWILTNIAKLSTEVIHFFNTEYSGSFSILLPFKISNARNWYRFFWKCLEKHNAVINFVFKIYNYQRKILYEHVRKRHVVFLLPPAGMFRYQK